MIMNGPPWANRYVPQVRQIPNGNWLAQVVMADSGDVKSRVVASRSERGDYNFEFTSRNKAVRAARRTAADLWAVDEIARKAQQNTEWTNV